MATPTNYPGHPPTAPIQGQPGALPGKNDGNDCPPPPPRKPKA